MTRNLGRECPTARLVRVSPDVVREFLQELSPSYMVALLCQIIGYSLSVSLRRRIKCLLGVCGHQHTTFVSMLAHAPLLADRGFTLAAGGEKVFCIDLSSVVDLEYYLFPAMKKPLSQKQTLALRCPTCGAPPGQKCELSTGQPRFEPHQARRFKAADEKIEKGS